MCEGRRPEWALGNEPEMKALLSVGTKWMELALMIGFLFFE